MNLNKFLTQRKALPIFSWRICYAMFTTELKMMMSFLSFTVIAPIITSTLMIMVFKLILPEGLNYSLNGIPFLIFITPGLVMMNITQNAFSQPAFSLVGRRMFGSLNEILLTPINAIEFTLAQTASGVTRGIILGMITFVACLPFVPSISIASPLTAIFYIIFSASLMALIGLICGIISPSWEKLSIYTEYILIPLSFLSGTFYAIDRLPTFFQQLTLFNPFFYLIDGLRYSFTGNHEASIWHGILYIIALNIVLFIIACQLIIRGVNLRN